MPNTLADWSSTAELRGNLTPSRRTGPRIAGIAVSDSESTYSQEQVLERLGLKGDEFAERIFARSGVKRRHLDLSEDFLGKTLQGRAQQIEQDLLRHSIHAVDALGLDPLEIGTVVSASLYSLGCPALAHRLVDHYGMDPATDKYHISGVGCASGVPLMRLAIQTMREQPGKQALVVAAESMSGMLMPAKPDDPRAKTVGSAMFGDGCAAACSPATPTRMARSSSPRRFIRSRARSTPSAWTSPPRTATCTSPASCRTSAAAGCRTVAGFLRRNHLERSDIDHWMAIPAAGASSRMCRARWGSREDDLATSWGALAEHGNIGTPSILYVLADTVEQREPAPGEHGLLVTIGPGVTLGLMLLGW